MFSTLIQKILSISSTLELGRAAFRIARSVSGAPHPLLKRILIGKLKDSDHQVAVSASLEEAQPDLQFAIAPRKTQKTALAFSKAASVSKTGGQANEDSFSFSKDGLVCAVCDGATISYNSAAWAAFLALKAINDPIINLDWVDLAIKELADGIDRDALTWMQQAAYDRGSFSTLTIARFDQRTNSLTLFAIGDTNVFVVDREKLRLAFPNTNAAQFSNSPHLISTLRAENIELESHLVSAQSAPIDIRTLRNPLVCIATDALAVWILQQRNTGKALVTLSEMTAQEFYKFVLDERKAGRMRIDDTTLLIMRRR